MAPRTASTAHFGKRQHVPHHVIIARGDHVRRLTLPPGVLLGIVAVGVVGLLWTAAVTGFIVFKDDFIAGMARRQTQMQYDYEDRIAGLQAEIARMRSRELVEGQSMAERVDSLVRRQASLESRQSIVQSIADIADAAGVKAAQPPMPAAPAPVAAAGVPRPLPEDGAPPAAAPGKQARLDTGRLRVAGSVEDTLAAVAASLDRVESHQLGTVVAIASAASRRTDTIRDALDGLGLDAARLARPGTAPLASDEGGPYVPLEPPSDATPFEHEAYRAQVALAQTEGLDQATRRMPLHPPFAHAEITSGFGVRIDPFLGTGAMHAGIDFRQQSGEPVRATAAGQIVSAGWSGGYGNMVEIDHGNGITTRYGHLSEILVSPGDKVAAGGIVGRVGSTGRSTGPHLHYETRIDGLAIDPQRFLHAGERIAGAS